MDQKPSEIITEFLKFLESAKNEYESAYADVGAEDRKEQTFLHDLEFALNKNERNKVATRFQQSRRARRKAKRMSRLRGKNICLGTGNLRTGWNKAVIPCEQNATAAYAGHAWLRAAEVRIKTAQARKNPARITPDSVR